MSIPPAPTIHGKLVDKQSRCEHWHGPLDVIALKLKCCNKYYACYECHNELESHPISKYNIAEPHVNLIVCGVCNHEMSFDSYASELKCPRCSAPFNPGCKLHYDMYFYKGDK
ncbi:helper of Tim protein 13 [Kluyveromyces marxianus]|nr:helper of Tim protein 13 [Kluyveromyces marxianus]